MEVLLLMEKAFVLICLWYNTAATVTEHTTKDYCLNEKFEASCPDNGVIVIESALYGRMTFGSCVKRDYGYIGCSVDVTRLLGSKCSARQKCEVVNFETLFAAYNRCPDDLKSYLQASYYCKQMSLPLDPEQCTSGYVEPLLSGSDQSGFLTPAERRWGTEECPWRIRVRPGQRINLTLHDYSDFGIQNGQQPAFCKQYFIVTDGDKDKTIMSCSHELRSRTVYLSTTNDILIYFTINPDIDASVHFLLEFRVEGCPLPSLPANSYVIRNKDRSITIQCNYSLESWRLQCEDSRWQGEIGNCTTPGAARHTEHLVPLGISIIIIVAVALLVCTAVLVIGFLIFYCRRRERHRRMKAEGRFFAVHNTALSEMTNPNTVTESRTKHASLEKTRPSYSPLSKSHTVRTHSRAGEYTHIWQVKQPIPVRTPEVPKSKHHFRRGVTASSTTPMMTSARSSPTMTSARSPMLPERRRDHMTSEHVTRRPTFSTFKPGADPYGLSAIRGEQSAESSQSNVSSPLYFEIDTQRRNATNHYST